MEAARKPTSRSCLQHNGVLEMTFSRFFWWIPRDWEIAEVHKKMMSIWRRWPDGSTALVMFMQMVILLKNETRISHSLRENLQFFQRRFGKKNVGSHSDGREQMEPWNKSTEEKKGWEIAISQTVWGGIPTEMLQQDASGDGEDSDLGVGLSKERAEKVPFFFVDTHYDRDDEDEVKSMENELREMKRWLRSLLEWKSRSQQSVRRAQGPHPCRQDHRVGGAS